MPTRAQRNHTLPHAPQRPRHDGTPAWTLGRRHRVWCLAPAALMLATAGCSTRNDPGYNRYAPTDGDPGVLRRIESVVDIPVDTLDNLDERLENELY